MGYEAYHKAQTNVSQGAELEAEAFLRAASLLERARMDLTDRKSLQKAISFTRKLWTIVQADVSSAKNTLSDRVKADLLSLSLYVDRETVEISITPSDTKLSALIDVNRQIASGLMHRK